METASTEIKASLNYLHIAPRKVRLVTNLIKGMDAKRAETELARLSKRSARPVLKLLKSAVANAQNNFHLESRALYVKSIRVDGGPVLKRSMPRAFGRAALIRHRTSHVSLILGVTPLPLNETDKSADRKDGELFSGKNKAERSGDRVNQSKKRSEIPKKKIRAEKPLNKTEPAAGFSRKIFRRKAI